MSVVSWAKSQTTRPMVSRWAKPGWIGIDVGTHAIKLAQLERSGSGYRIAARWTITDPSHCLAKEAASRPESLGAQLLKVRELKRLFVGSKCAAALPSALVELRSFAVPTGTPAELQRMAGEELAVDLGVEPQELAFDCWETPGVGRPDPGMTRVSVTSVPKKLATQLGDSLLSAGLACQVLDVMPCAMARAVELAAVEPLGDSIIAIDLSYTMPVIVLVKGGSPIFTRVLRGVGMHSVMQPLESGLGISLEECEQLLVRFGIVAGGTPPTLASERTTELIAQPLQELISEIERTVEYVAAQFRNCKPQQLCLFGGGALIKNLPEYVSDRLGMPARPWCLRADEPVGTDPLFGVAAGLSSLAWEETPCS